AQPGREFGIHRHSAEQARGKWQLVTSGKLPGKRLLAQWIVRHIVLRAIEDLLAIVARVKPRAGINRLPVEVIAANDRFAQEDRIGDDRDVRQVVVVPDEVLHQRGLIALWHAVAAAKRAVLHVCRANDESIPDELARREPPERVWCPCRRVRTPVHPNDPMSFRCLRPYMNRNQALRVFLTLFPDAEVTERSHLIRSEIGLTLMVPQRDARRVVRQRPESAGLIDRKAA